MTNHGAKTGRTNVAFDTWSPQYAADNFRMAGYKLRADTVNLAAAKAWLDSAVADGRIIYIYAHEITASGASTENQWDLADFEALYDYAIGLGMLPVTADDLYNLNTGPVRVRRGRVR